MSSHAPGVQATDFDLAQAIELFFASKAEERSNAREAPRPARPQSEVEPATVSGR